MGDNRQTLEINPGTWREFRRAVEEKHGTYYGNMTKELDRAIKLHTAQLRRETEKKTTFK